mmetsp:Transcript_4513/g.9801  ORF Transcript_4513/g.9801 Transcript_4513/m.9801 type:complete len:228 (+) Transcript_4513:79-762(+)
MVAKRMVPTIAGEAGRKKREEKRRRNRRGLTGRKGKRNHPQKTAPRPSQLLPSRTNQSFVRWGNRWGALPTRKSTRTKTILATTRSFGSISFERKERVSTISKTKNRTLPFVDSQKPTTPETSRNRTTHENFPARSSRKAKPPSTHGASKQRIPSARAWTVSRRVSDNRPNTATTVTTMATATATVTLVRLLLLVLVAVEPHATYVDRIIGLWRKTWKLPIRDPWNR